MSLFRLLTLTLLYHWRGNLAVLLGVVVGSAVLTGALLVGDSLQGSLRVRALAQLDWVQYALVTPRFFSEALAGEVRVQTDFRVAPAILLRSTVAVPGEGLDHRTARGVTVLGVDDAFFRDRGKPGKAFVFVNEELARELDLRDGSALDVRLLKPSALPREAVLARKDLGVTDWRVEVTRVLRGDETGNRFNLRPGLEEPLNLLVPLSQLQGQLGLKGEINALFADGDGTALRAALKDHLGLIDYGLTLFTPVKRANALVERYDRNRDGELRGPEWQRRVDGKRKPRFAEIVLQGLKSATPDTLTLEEITEYFQREHPYIVLESKQLLLTPPVARLAEAAGRGVGLRPQPTLVYLARMRAGEQRVAGVIAAVPPGFLSQRTEGPDDILLVEEGWPKDTRPKVGASLEVAYKPPESHGPTPDLAHTFRVAGYVPMRGRAADPWLTPEFPGITDKDEAGDWTLPFDDPNWQQQTIRREYTDAYWEAYRATPKAYISLATGQKLWGSRFGNVTSIRFVLDERKAPDRAELAKAARRLTLALRKELSPEENGFAFDNVKATALEASRGGTPFGLLFLGFSFFLILSALLLVGLLYRLNLDRRAQQVGLLYAEGFPRSTVQGLLLGEGSVLALIGAVLGVVAAMGYSRLLVQMLAALWPGGVLRSFLEPHWTTLSLAAGAGGAFVVSVLTIAWVVRGLSKAPPRALLAGQTTGEGELGVKPATWRLIAVVIFASVAGLILLVVGPFVPGHEAQAGTFFGSGALFLSAGLCAVLAWMKRARHRLVEGHGVWNIGRLGVRNAARHPARSLLTAGLIASAAFLLVAVESFRRRAHEGDGSIKGPDGGFALMAESDLPVLRDLNSTEGRDEVLAQLNLKLAVRMAPAEVKRHVEDAEAILKQTRVVALRVRAGDDASCLNLYQPGTPRVIGVPAALIERGGFVFDATKAKTAKEKDNPWLLLEGEGQDTPAFGEKNTVMWMLKSGLGGTIKVPDGGGEEVKLEIVGLLHDSVFHSSLLVSERRFLKLYPGQEGYNFFLIAPPQGKADEVKRVLETALEDRGFAVTRSADRLAAYLAVENTYLTTFQALGGLGLILGSLGLAVVLLRSVWERRAELALFRALGWPRPMIGWLVLAEDAFLLLVGLAVGTAAALLSITPQLVAGGGSVPWRELGLLFGVVLVVALTAGALAVVGTLRAPIVPALRRE